MADNTTLNTGTGGDVIATDDISGVKYQRVKIALGADGVSDGDVSSSNAMPVSDNGGSLTVDGTVAATQSGNWSVRVFDGSGNTTVTTLSAPTGSERGLVVRNIPSGTQTVSGTVTANAGTGTMNVSVQNASIPVTDNGGSLTVDGTVAATQSGTWSTRTQDGSGNAVTSHSAGASRGIDVSIIDGSGNQVTSFGGGTQYADGTASATPTGTVAMGTDGTNVFAISTDAAGIVNVTINNASVPISDGGGSITVDGTVTATQQASTAYKVIISDGTSDVPIDAAHSDGETNTEPHIDVGAKNLLFNGSTWDRVRGDVTNGMLVNLGANNDVTVTGTVTVTDGLNVEGDVAHDAVDSGNPVKIGFQAESSLPAAVATGDRSNGISDVFGRQLVAHTDAGMQVWKGANYATTQTGTDIWTPSTGKKICMTYLAISSYGTTAARVILWLGASGDTTYTAGTDQLVWAGSFAPSANSKPGAIISLPFGITAVTADHRLKITTDAAISLDLTIYGYEC